MVTLSFDDTKEVTTIMAGNSGIRRRKRSKLNRSVRCYRDGGARSDHLLADR